jgi:hypothetical protein
MPDHPYLQWPVFRRSLVAAFQRSLTCGHAGPCRAGVRTAIVGLAGRRPSADADRGRDQLKEQVMEHSGRGMSTTRLMNDAPRARLAKGEFQKNGRLTLMSASER